MAPVMQPHVFIGGCAFTTFYVMATSPEDAERFAKKQLVLHGVSAKE